MFLSSKLACVCLVAGGGFLFWHGCVQSSPDINATQQTQSTRSNVEAYRLASDSSLGSFSRLAAITQLNDVEVARLRNDITQDIHGKNMVEFYDNINVLGKIGDQSTLLFLEKLADAPVNYPGQLNTAFHYAIANLRSRYPINKPTREKSIFDWLLN